MKEGGLIFDPPPPTPCTLVILKSKQELKELHLLKRVTGTSVRSYINSPSNLLSCIQRLNFNPFLVVPPGGGRVSFVSDSVRKRGTQSTTRGVGPLGLDLLRVRKRMKSESPSPGNRVETVVSYVCLTQKTPRLEIRS